MNLRNGTSMNFLRLIFLMMLTPGVYARITFHGVWLISWGVDQANNFSNLKRKNETSVTPLKLALKFLILELKDSAFALVFLLLKKFRMLSRWCSRELTAVLNSSIFDCSTLSFHF